MTLDLSQSLSLIPQSDDVFLARNDPDYFMRTGPYGGWVAAVLLNAAMSHKQAQGGPVSLTVNFLAPITAPEFRLIVTPQKITRTLSFMRVDAVQTSGDGEELAATALVILGPRRGDIHLPDISAPVDLPAPDAVAPFAILPGMPAFFSRYQLRYIKGQPFAENPTAHSLVYARDNPKRALDVLSLAALADVSLPRLMFRRPVFVPFATVSMSAYFQCSDQDIARVGADEVVIETRARQIRSGFFDQTLEIWSQSGVLLATSEQMCWFRAE